MGIDAFRSGGTRGLAAALRQSLMQLRDRHSRAFRSKARRAMEFGVRPHLLHGRVRHLYGPREVSYSPDELVVSTVVRNGEPYVSSFLEHYRALGVSHCVFLDNGSTDQTVERLRSCPNVTVLRTDVPYATYENTMKRYLAARFSRNRWNLYVDIDELFDYPLSSQLPLSGFLQYLNRHGFSAVVTQMLDLFADGPLLNARGTPQGFVWEECRYFDTSALDCPPYEWARPSRPEIRMHWGGIRRAVFGTDNGLTKSSLVLMKPGVKPFIEWHHVEGAVTADVTCVLRHYPFAADFQSKVDDAVRTKRYGRTTTGEYGAYARALAENPGLSLKRKTAQIFTGLDPLIEQGFLVVSNEYRAWAERYTSR